MKRTVEAKLSQYFGPSLGSSRLALRNDLHLARKVWHAGMGLVIVGIYLASGMSRTTAVQILGSALGVSLLMEMARLRSASLNDKLVRFWGPIMRSCEVDRFSGIPFYLASTVLAIAIFPKPIAALSILYLAIGDPLASLAGILWGKRSLRLPNGKSLIGTWAGMLACAMVSWLFLSSQGLPEHQIWVLTLIGGLTGGGAELLPLEVDDNFSIPVVSGFVLWFTYILLNF
jgi:diacylglycerol kinase (CTP)